MDEKAETQKEVTLKARIRAWAVWVWAVIWVWVVAPTICIMVAGSSTVIFLNEIFAYGLPYTFVKMFAGGLPWLVAYLGFYMALPVAIPVITTPATPRVVAIPLGSLSGMPGLPDVPTHKLDS